MCDFKWTPVRNLPTNYKDGSVKLAKFLQGHFPAWRPQTGLNYSAARFAEKYVGINVSFETYISALSNPDSVMYTRNLQGKHNLSSAYYGTVCSEFASYVFDLPFHIDCQQWSSLEDIEEIIPVPLEALQYYRQVLTWLSECIKTVSVYMLHILACLM